MRLTWLETSMLCGCSRATFFLSALAVGTAATLLLSVTEAGTNCSLPPLMGADGVAALSN